MAAIAVVAVALFKKALINGLNAMAGQAATAALVNPLLSRITRLRITSAIDKAFDGGVDRFRKTVNNATLLAALDQHPEFWEDPGLHEALATVILYPDSERRHDCLEAIESRFERIVPDMPKHLLRNPARCLLTSMRDSVLEVVAFSAGLEEFRDNVRNHLLTTSSRGRRSGLSKLPPVDEELQKGLLELAEDEALVCECDYISAAHLLIALADLSNSAASGVMADANVTPKRLRPVVARVVKRRNPAPVDGKPPRRPLPISESVHHAFYLAREGAQREEMSKAEDEQVLEALLDMVDLGERDGKSVAETLRQLSVPTTALRAPLNQFITVLRTFSGA